MEMTPDEHAHLGIAKGQMQKRIAMLADVAVIGSGAASAAEDTIAADCLAALRAAYEHGVVAGGGSALAARGRGMSG
jgi:hypothetical protein